MTVLAIQVFTVASESVFSTGGRILDLFRSSLCPKMVKALICTQNWVRSSHEGIQVKDYLDELQLMKTLSQIIIFLQVLFYVLYFICCLCNHVGLNLFVDL
ncbi:hypothetical protein CRYUN_Cryun36dG0038700 [Craigia yunnanensis]